MTQVSATWTGGTFKPDEPLPLADQTRVRLTVEPMDERAKAAAPPYRVSNEQRDALLGLIGIWKSDRPAGDDEVDRIVDEHRRDIP